MKFGLLFFGSNAEQASAWYDVLLKAARFADSHRLSFIGVPERHFGLFGGMFPNPSLLAAAIARETREIQIRACSLVLPLHHIVRVAEDWAVIDNLSGGRTALSIGSGWNVNDFVLAPDAYKNRHQAAVQGIHDLRKIWRDGVWRGRNAQDVEVELQVFPRPIQSQLPIWVTSSRNPETVITAAKIGANVLTHLENQNLDGVAEKVRLYRQERERAGLDPAGGTFTVMQHCFISDSREQVASAVCDLREYLARALHLETSSVSTGGEMSGRKQIDVCELANAQDDILDHAVEKYRNGLALIGDFATCRRRVRALEEIGVNEIACLVDFRRAGKPILSGLDAIGQLSREFSQKAKQDAASELLSQFLQDEG